jgi:hypothetical protein
LFSITFLLFRGSVVRTDRSGKIIQKKFKKIQKNNKKIQISNFFKFKKNPRSLLARSLLAPFGFLSAALGQQ